MRAWVWCLGLSAVTLAVPLRAAPTRVCVGLLRAAKPSSIVAFTKYGISITTSADKRFQSPHVSISCVDGRLSLDGRRSGAILLTSRGPITIAAGCKSGAYRGRIRVSARGGRLLIVNEIGLEDYVRGVLANEMKSDWSVEALEAQAVVARTLAVFRARSHAADGFDLCDTTHCQVYRGMRSETARTNAAVYATRGVIMTYAGRPVNALYHSTCGGATTGFLGRERIPNAPYLRKISDTLDGKAACSFSPHFAWRSRISGSDLAHALSSNSRTSCGPSIRGLDIIGRDSSSRVTALQIKGEKSVTCDGYVFMNAVCRKLGWAKIKSARFNVLEKGSQFEFSGHGLGHGIGMCQWGAKFRAEAGWGYKKILSFYYPGSNFSAGNALK